MRFVGAKHSVVEYSNGSREKAVLTGMIMNRAVLAQISDHWEDGLMASSFANLIARWCVKHYREYGVPPQRSIRTYFDEWASVKQDDATVQKMEEFLHELSREYEERNWETNGEIQPTRVLDVAGKWFNFNRLKKVTQDAQDLADAGRLDDAMIKLTGYDQVRVGQGGLKDPHEEGEYAIVFEDRPIPLLDFGGNTALDRFYSASLSRRDFVAFCAPEKVGKSFLLLDIAFRAMMNRKRVAYFEAGDMGEEGFKERLYCRESRHPFEPGEDGWPCTVKIPRKLKSPGEGEDFAKVTEWEERDFDGPLSEGKAKASWKRLLENKIRMKQTPIRYRDYPAGELTTTKIFSLLRQEASRGWDVDVVVIDYADIMGPPDGAKKSDKLEQQNATWEQLRKLSQVFKCLVVTATQANRAGYERDLLNRTHISGDKRKLSHVSGMIGVSVTGDEQDQGVMRLNWFGLRRGKYKSRRVCHVAGCLALADPCVLSTF